MKEETHMKWTNLYSEEDVSELMYTFESFHDACLKELWYGSDNYVDRDLAMNMGWNTCARMLFQRQKNNPAVIELEFRSVGKLILNPSPLDYSSEILGASMYWKNGIIHWADEENWSEDIDSNCTWIAARKARWRIISNDCLGDRNIYLADI
jgi:hypothetical protein